MSHSEIGPSSADRWWNCAGSVNLGRGLPDLPTSEYAAEGTVAHRLSEEYMNGKMTDLQLMDRVGEIVEQEGHQIEITEEMIQVVLAYAHHCQADVDALRSSGKPAQVHNYTELKVTISSIDEELRGTADKVIFRKGDKLIVRDLKYGKGKRVSAPENKQAVLYLLGAMETVAGEAFDDVELVIDQLRVAEPQRWTVPREWLKKFKEEAREAVARTKLPNAPLKAGDWCRWCKAQTVCPELRGVVEREAETDFATPPRALTQRVESMPVGKLAQLLNWSDAIEAYLKAAWHAAEALLQNGQDVPGYKLVRGKSNRGWSDKTGEQAAAWLKPEYGDRVYQERKVKSVAQIEKLVGKKKMEELASMVFKPEAALKMAPCGDERVEEALTSAQQDFAPRALAVDSLFGPPVFCHETQAMTAPGGLFGPKQEKVFEPEIMPRTK